MGGVAYFIFLVHCKMEMQTAENILLHIQQIYVNQYSFDKLKLSIFNIPITPFPPRLSLDE